MQSVKAVKGSAQVSGATLKKFKKIYMEGGVGGGRERKNFEVLIGSSPVPALIWLTWTAEIYRRVI